jgi:hypothetical protein
MSAPAARGGRPRGLLSERRRAQLEAASRAIREAEQARARARGELRRVARAAHADGASVRTIGETIGLAPSAVHRLIGGE